MKIAVLNGFKDILPDEVSIWQQVEAKAREVFSRFHFMEIRLPILEKTELFARSIGEMTDIVEKEMYTFVDKGVTMRPEATASLLRAYIQHGLYVQKPVQRLFTIGPMFRYERPQKGRLRQFHQMSAELLGAPGPLVDAEIMAMGSMILEELGLQVSLELNSLGCKACRPTFRKKLLSFLHESMDILCDDCRRRAESNPLRVLDCKKPQCRELVQSAPSIQDNLCTECDGHFNAVQQQLDTLGVEYRLNRFMVRGLDYYCRTTFEFITGDLGAQAAVGAGGRYDGLVEQLGGPKVPGIGFALGIERLVLLLGQQQESRQKPETLDVFIAGLGKQASTYSFGLVHELRKNGISALMDHEARSLKSQMKQADKAGAAFVCIIGDDEIAKGTALFRDMKTKEQQDIGLESAEIIQRIIKEKAAGC